MEKAYDIIVIGAGPGGIAAAKEAKRLGASVALIEKERIGGVCLNKGCIPTKTLIHEAKMFRTVRRMIDGEIILPSIVSASIKPNWPKMLENAASVIKINHGGMESAIKSLFGADLFYGEAVILPGDKVKVKKNDGAEIALDYKKGVIVATGSSPKKFKEFAQFEDDAVLYSDDIFKLQKLPKKILIVGGGAIGCEFASFFANLGVEVIIVEYFSTLLPKILDEDFSRNTIMREFKKPPKKINVITGASLKGIEKDGSGRIIAALSDGQFFEVNKILIAAGRMANLEVLGDLKLKDIVDDNIFIIGDARGVHGAAYTADKEGVDAVNCIMRTSDDCGTCITTNGLLCIRRDTEVDKCLSKNILVPYVVFSDPEIAVVGLTEKSVIEKGIKFKITKYLYHQMGRPHCDSRTAGEVKMLVNADDNRVVGVQLFGDCATEIIQIAYVLMNQKISYKGWIDLLWPHPVYGEIFKEALKTLKC